MKSYEIKIDEGERYEIVLQAVACGDDISVTICGGTKHHVGAVALACGKMPDGSKPKYSATVSTLVVMDHKDDVVARKTAGIIADEFQTNVTVTAGIHIDDAQPQELKKLQENAMKACELFINEYKEK